MDFWSLLGKALQYAAEQITEGAEKGKKAPSMSDAELLKKIKSGGSGLSSLKERTMYANEYKKRHQK